MTSNSKLQAQATISKVMTMCDNTVRLWVDTQDMGAEDKAALFGLYNKIGWFLFAEAEESLGDAQELPEVHVDRGEKTPSERLRAVIYRIWENTSRVRNSEDFYRSTMEDIITKMKAKIDG